MAKKKVVLIHRRAPGDTLVLTALVRDIALTLGDEFEIDVETSAMDLWKHNPHLANLKSRRGRKKDVEYFKISYGKGIREQNGETIHFMSYFYRSFNERYQTNLVPQFPYPDLHLSEQERVFRAVNGRYWIIIGGGKSDFTAKVWEIRRFQQVADELRQRGIGVVQCGSSDKGHWHPPIDGALNLVGSTNLRDLAKLIYHADGVICGVTLAMHMAAALQRPCVTVAGGREAWWWEAYVNENDGFGPKASGNLEMPHQFLHTIGQLDCCRYHGCWKNKVTSTSNDKSVCYYPIPKIGQTIPKCMDMIGAKHVVDAVMSYYKDNKLPPVDGSLSAPPSTESAQKSAAPKWDIFADVATTAETAPDIMPPTIELTGQLEGRPHGFKQAAVVPAGTRVHPAPQNQTQASTTTDFSSFNNPIIGGSYTFFVLLYGDYPDMHRHCLDSIIQTVPKKAMDLRIGSNELCDTSLGYVNQLVEQGLVTKHYRHAENVKKYPVMREMFYDTEHPIKSNYLLWFDDDTICNKDAQWLLRLSDVIIENHNDGYRMYGPQYIWNIRNSQREWIKSSAWYKGRPFRDSRGRPSSGGGKIHFATGSFWALEVEAMQRCDIPDMRIGHNGGDYMIGEQLYQGGYKLKSFSSRKSIVNWSAHPRRGLKEVHTGL